MKRLVLPLVLVILVLLAGCSANANYDVAKTSHADTGIEINYPQITHLRDSSKQQRINDLIKNEALNILNQYEDEIDQLSLDIDYMIKFKSLNVLSIEYLGYANVIGAAHPSNIMYTSNIDMKKASSLRLGDLLVIDESLAQKYQQGKYRPWSSDLNLESLGALADVMASISSDDLIEQMQQPSPFYFTEDSLGVSVSVSHAAGDHLELETPYQGLGSNIKQDNPVWQEFTER